MVVLVTNGDITILQQTPLGLCQMDAIQYSWRVQIVQKKIKMCTVAGAAEVLGAQCTVQGAQW